MPSLLDSVISGISGLFSKKETVTAGDFIKSFKTQNPQFASLPDEEVAATMAERPQYSFLKGYSPDAPLAPDAIPLKNRLTIPGFYDKFPDLAQGDAQKTVEAAKASRPKLYGDLPPDQVAARLEAHIPALKGLAGRLSPPAPKETAPLVKEAVAAIKSVPDPLEAAARGVTEAAKPVAKAITPGLSAGRQSLTWMKSNANAAENALIQKLLPPASADPTLGGPMESGVRQGLAASVVELGGIYKGFTGGDMELSPESLKALKERKISPEIADTAGQIIGGYLLFGTVGKVLGTAKIAGSVEHLLYPNLEVARILAPAAATGAQLGATSALQEAVRQVREGKLDLGRLGKVVAHGTAFGGVLGAFGGFTNGALRLAGAATTGAVMALDGADPNASPKQIGTDAIINAGIFSLFELAGTKGITLAQKEGALRGARRMVGDSVADQAFESALKSGYSPAHAEELRDAMRAQSVEALDKFIAERGGKHTVPEIEQFAKDFKTQVQEFIKPKEGEASGNTLEEATRNQSIVPSLRAPVGSGPESGKPQSDVFPPPRVSSFKDIAGHPDFVKLTSDAAAVVNKYASERGIKPSPRFAESLFRELHDAFGSVKEAAPEKRAEVARQVLAQYPDIEREFSTLKSKLYTDKTDTYFERFVAGKYGPMRPAVAVAAEQSSEPEVSVNERLPAPGSTSTAGASPVVEPPPTEPPALSSRPPRVSKGIIKPIQSLSELNKAIDSLPEKPQKSAPTLKSEVIPGSKEFIEQDVAPAVKAAGEAVAKVADDIQRAFAPTTRGAEAKLTAGIVRENAAELARKKEVAYKALDLAARTFDKLPKETNYDFIDKMESGQPQAVKELQPVADQLRKLLDDRRAEIQSLGTGKLEHFIKDYFPHIWKDPVKAGNVFARVFGKRPLEGSKSFLKKRTIESFKEGIEKGLEPVTDNPVEMAMLKVHEMDRYLMGQRTFQEMKDKGMAKFVRFGEDAPEGYAKVNDKIGTVYGDPNIPIKEGFDPLVVKKLNDFAKSIGLTHDRMVHIGGKRFGYAMKGSGHIVTKFATPDSVIAHEIGHQLDWKYGLQSKLIKNPLTKQELKNLADLRFEGGESSKSFKRYVRKGEEKMAVIFEAFIHAPEKFKETAPNTYKFLLDFIDSHEELKPLLDIKPSLVLGSGSSTVHAGGLVITGQYYAPEAAARILDNYLSPGLKGNVLYDALRSSGNLMNQVQLGMSAFHLGFTTIDSLVSRAALGIQQLSRGEFKKGAVSVASGLDIVTQPVRNYIKGDKVLREYFAPGSQGEEMAKIVDALIAGGGRVKMDSFYKNSSVESFWKAMRSGNYPGAALRSAPALIESLAKPIMEVVVPRQKLGVFFDMAQEELARLPADASREQVREVMGKAWDSVDNRMGQLVYDNLFWNKALKDLGLSSVRSLGWNLGTIRELGGGAFVDAPRQAFRAFKGERPEVTSRMAYVLALPFIVGVFGGMLHYLMTGEHPKEVLDYYFPRTGKTRPDGKPERISFPSYMKDIYAHYESPLGTLGHKIHPILSSLIDMFQNKDYYGVQIRNADAPLVQQAEQVFEFAAKQFVPFSVRNYSQRRAAGGSVGQSVESFFGLTPAPGYIYQSEAEKKALNFVRMRIPTSRTQEDFKKSQDMKQVVDSLRGGEDVVGKLESALRDKKITPSQARQAYQKSRSSALQSAVKHIPFSEAMSVLEVATPEERESLKIEMFQKFGNSLRNMDMDERRAALEKLKEYYPDVR